MPPKKSTGKSNKTLARRAPVTGSKRADTLFPVGRCNRLIRQGRYSDRVGASAGVFMAAVLEYICGEFLEAATQVCLEKKRTILKPSHINLGAKSDECLEKLLHMCQISEGGFMSNINEALMPMKKKNKGMAADGSQVV